MTQKLFSVAGTLFFIAFLALGLLLLGSLVPVAGGYQIRIVESGSMSPTIPLGSAIVVRPADSYTVGDIITYQRAEDDEVTTHRIIEEKKEEGKPVFVVQGDANNTPDLRSVEPREIVGSVRLSIPYLGFILDFIRQPIGFVILIIVPALWVVYEQWQRIRVEMRKHTESSKNEQQ